MLGEDARRGHEPGRRRRGGGRGRGRGQQAGRGVDAVDVDVVEGAQERADGRRACLAGLAAVGFFLEGVALPRHRRVELVRDHGVAPRVLHHAQLVRRVVQHRVADLTKKGRAKKKKQSLLATEFDTTSSERASSTKAEAAVVCFYHRAGARWMDACVETELLLPRLKKVLTGTNRVLYTHAGSYRLAAN